MCEARNTLVDLVTRWREEAAIARERFGDEQMAKVILVRADDLDSALKEMCEELLTLKQAAAESGYSADRLGDLVREGKIPNAGRRGAPRIRRADLPRKAGSDQMSGAKNEQRGSMEGLFRDITASKRGER